MKGIGTEYQGEGTFEKANMFGKGEPNDAYARYFTGNSFLNAIASDPGQPFVANVTFGPGCHNCWHIANAKAAGATAEEMVTIVTHVEFYVGWPKACATFNLCKKVYAHDANEQGL